MQTFSAQNNSRYYSMEMALDSGLITGDTSTREAALGVPAVLKGRNMICNIATLPLQLLDTTRKPVQHSWFSQLDPQVPNVVTLAMTIEDLLFDGIAWWKKMTTDVFGFPKAVQHVDCRRVTVNPPTSWINALPSGFDPDSTVWIDGKPIDAHKMIRFDSPNPPLLVAAARAIRRAIQFENTASMYAEDPRPLDYFSPGDNAGSLDEEAVKGIIRGWIAARKKRSTGFVPETLKYNTVQSPNPQELQLVGLMERAALDIANAIGVDAEDLGISTTSRTYQNDVSRRQDRVNDVLSGYMKAITDRLSMNDVTRRGYKAYIDLDDYLRADPKTRWEINKIAVELEATDVEEIRERENWVEKKITPRALPAPVVVAKPAEDPALEPIPAQNSRKESNVTFSSASKNITLRADGDSTSFSVDTERRVITGTALIFNTPATNDEGTFTFAPGSIEWKKSAINRVKFLRDHDWNLSVGAALSIRDTGEALDTKFKVARGPLGDQALNDAEDMAADGLSVGIDITDWDELPDGSYYVKKATLNEVSLTPRPAFDDARLTSVAASNTKGKNMVDEVKPDVAPEKDALPANFQKAIEATVAAFLAAQKNVNPDDKGTNELTLSKTDKDESAEKVNSAARPTPGEAFAKTKVNEKSPYTFDRAGRFVQGEHDFSTDFGAMLREHDLDGKRTEFGKRVMGHIAANFVTTGNVDELNPAIQRPDMYYNPPGSRTPLWDLINKGAPPNGVQPFTLPKFNSASGMTADHTEGVEPATGTFTTTSQTITPTPVSGKVSVSREVIDMGGNPATSNLIWQRMVRSYEEAREAAAATFINSLTAATDITITTAAVDKALAKELKAMLVSLNFLPGYDWDGFAMEQGLYTVAANAVDDNGRPLYPTINPSNADGTMPSSFERLNLGSVVGVPAPGLPAVAGTANNSWLFDRSIVHGYSTAPQRFEFAGTAAVTTEDPKGSYAPVAMVDIAIWGYKAFANIDIAGVRQVIYDETV